MSFSASLTLQLICQTIVAPSLFFSLHFTENRGKWRTRVMVQTSHLKLNTRWQIIFNATNANMTQQNLTSLHPQKSANFYVIWINYSRMKLWALRAWFQLFSRKVMNLSASGLFCASLSSPTSYMYQWPQILCSIVVYIFSLFY